METSALNVAHAKQRRAEALLRERRFEEAADCHEEVASLLGELRTEIEGELVDLRRSIPGAQSVSSPLTNSFHSVLTLESLSLQRDYHLRQAALVRMKQAQYEEYKATLESQQRDSAGKRALKRNEKSDVNELSSDKIDGSLRRAIYRTIEEQDSLLGLILLPEGDDKTCKHSKDTGIVIEELRAVNCQLRTLVGSLLNQLETKEREVQQLTERLHAISVSPNPDSRYDDTNSPRLEPLPPLAPLEMPLFDFRQ